MLGEDGGPLQRTLKTEIGCRGVGLHSGERVTMKMIPAPTGTGIIFRRTDVTAEIRASWERVVELPRCTALADEYGTLVGTVEHLMAALAGAGIDNLYIELDGPEVPIMDGSAAPFLFQCAGTVEQNAIRRAIKVLKPVRVTAPGAAVALYPDCRFALRFEIDFENALIRRQELALSLDPATFKTELSRARTFGFADDVERLRAAGLARGGSLDNVLVVDGDHVLNRDGLRYQDEFVRHKILDAVGDLYLAGAPIIGRFHGVCSGHAHNRSLLEALFADEQAWAYAPAAAAPSRPGVFAAQSEVVLADA